MTDEEFLQGVAAGVRRAREAKRYTMRHLCDLLKCGSSMFWKIEHARGWVSLRTLKRIADILEIPVANLIPIHGSDPFVPNPQYENPEPPPDAPR